MIEVAEFWDIAVFAAVVEGGICAGSKRVVGKARTLADSLGCYLKVIVGLKDVVKEAIWLGADIVYVYKDKDEDALLRFTEKEKPEILLFCNCEDANILSVFVAHRFQTGLCTNIFDARIDTSDRKMITKALRFSRKLVVEHKINGYPQIAVFDDTKLPEPFINKEREGKEVEF
jgi:electron transfer flavoprotein alpha subunit